MLIGNSFLVIIKNKSLKFLRMESSKSHWIVENDLAKNAKEEFKGDISLKRNHTVIVKDNDSH